MQLFTNCIDYFSHDIHSQCLERSTNTVDTIYSLEHLTNLTEFRSFLGTNNGFRRFWRRLARGAARGNKKLPKGLLCTFEKLSHNKTSPPGDAENEVWENRSIGSSRFARQLDCRNNCLIQRSRPCQVKEASTWTRPTNLILFSFVEDAKREYDKMHSECLAVVG